MRRAITGLFKSLDQCEKAFREIDYSGLANNQVSIVVRKSPASDFNYEYAAEVSGESAVGLLHDFDSMLVQVHDIHLEDMGTVAAGGPLAGALQQGDKTLPQCLSYYGVSRDRSQHIQNYVNEGYVLALVETDNSNVNEAANILNHYGAHRVEKWSKGNSRPLIPHN